MIKNYIYLSSSRFILRQKCRGGTGFFKIFKDGKLEVKGRGEMYKKHDKEHPMSNIRPVPHQFMFGDLKDYMI